MAEHQSGRPLQLKGLNIPISDSFIINIAFILINTVALINFATLKEVCIEHFLILVNNDTIIDSNIWGASLGQSCPPCSSAPDSTHAKWNYTSRSAGTVF